jgi:hypothetical protein
MFASVNVDTSKVLISMSSFISNVSPAPLGWSQKFPQPRQETTVHLTFPDRRYLPTVPLQFRQMRLVSLAVARDLGPPVGSVGFRLASTARALVTMPEATMDKDQFAST